ncbi:Lipase 1 [Camponotus floridanus]|uniref:Lipase 1 n=1 Tax=Camponotus floridanus TaxID=104421 RepID=E2A785_CAMFO|nr:Lipase 1 [Camponotus floridanus]
MCEIRHEILRFLGRLYCPLSGHFPAGTSVKTVRHYAQEIQSGKFCKFDYDRATNLIIYNSEEPPDYNLTSITVPIALFYSKNDLLADIEDVKRLAPLLPNVVDMYEVPWPTFSHTDFLWAKDAPKLVYERIFKIMNRENRNNVTSVE